MLNLGDSSLRRWRSKHLSASNTGVPESPGVYVIGHRDAFHGLDLKRLYVYVGESKDLHRRLDEHLPDTEENADLRAYLRQNYTDLICWYLPTEASGRIAIQNDLIYKIKTAIQHHRCVARSRKETQMSDPSQRDIDALLDVMEIKQKEQLVLSQLLEKLRSQTSHHFVLQVRMGDVASYLTSVPLRWVAQKVGFAADLPIFREK